MSGPNDTAAQWMLDTIFGPTTRGVTVGGKTVPAAFDLALLYGTPAEPVTSNFAALEVTTAQYGQYVRLGVPNTSTNFPASVGRTKTLNQDAAWPNFTSGTGVNLTDVIFLDHASPTDVWWIIHLTGQVSLSPDGTPPKFLAGTLKIAIAP